MESKRLPPVYLSSDTIDAVGWKLNRLFVRFKSGAAYVYDKVPFSYFVSLQEVESAGKFLNQYVKKGGFRYTKLDSDPFSG
jgi:hypothetical protein